MKDQAEARPLSLWILGLTSFASLAAMRACDAILPLLASDFSSTTGAAAQTISAFAVGYGALQLFYGPMGDRLGRARVMWWATLACAAANLGLAMADTLQVAVAWRLLAGAASGGIVPLSIALIGDQFTYHRRQEMLSRLMIATILGMISGQWVGALIAERAGWRVTFVVAAALFLLTACLLLPASRREVQGRLALANAGPMPWRATFADPIVQVFRQPWARWILATVMAEGALAYAAVSFVPSFLHREFGLSLAQAGAVAALYGVGGLAFALTARWLIPWLGERRLITVGGGLLGAGLALLTLTSTWRWAAPACLAAGAGFYMLHSTLQTHATQMAAEVRGTAISCFVFSLFLGQSLGVSLAAVAVDHASPRWAFGIGAFALPALAIVFAFRLARRQRPLTEP